MRLQLFLIPLLLTPFIHTKLSEEENQKRLDTCGKNIPHFWYNLELDKVAVPISPRHLFTTSFTHKTKTAKVSIQKFSGKGTVLLLIQDVQMGKCRHVEVNSLQYYILSPVESIDDPNLITPVITRAYFPYFCKTPPLLNSTWSIVVEVEEDLKTDFPCFTKEDGVKVGDVFNVSAVPLNNELGNWTVTVSQLEDLFISVQTEPQDLPYYGGAYFKKLDDRWNSIGYAYEVPVDKLTRMSVYVDTLCDWAGICEPPISTTKTPIPNKSKKNEEKNGKGADNGKTQNGYEIIFLLILIPLFF